MRQRDAVGTLQAWGISPRAIRPADNSPSRRHYLPYQGGAQHVRTYSACLTVSVLLS